MKRKIENNKLYDSKGRELEKGDLLEMGFLIGLFGIMTGIFELLEVIDSNGIYITEYFTDENYKQYYARYENNNIIRIFVDEFRLISINKIGIADWREKYERSNKK